MPTGHRFSSIGGALLAICFFLPWVAVSCGGSQIGHVSGLDLAVGQVTVDAGFGGIKQELDGGGDPVLFLVPLAGVGAIALAIRAMGRTGMDLLDRLGPIALGALSLLILILKLVNSSSGTDDLGFTISYRAGLWGVVLGSLALIVGGLVNSQAPVTGAAGLPPRLPGPPPGETKPGPPKPRPVRSSPPATPSRSVPQARQEPQPRQPAGELQTCPGCHRQVKAGSRFCMHCGHPLQD